MTTPKQPKITFVTNYDDWQGLYVDGVLYTENHSLTLRDLASAADLEMETLDVSGSTEKRGRWLGDEVGSLPQNLKDIPKRAIRT